MDYGCRIGKVKMKSGGAPVSIVPQSNYNFTRVCMGWAELVFRPYDDQEVTAETLVYMLECAKHMIINKDKNK